MTDIGSLEVYHLNHSVKFRQKLTKVLDRNKRGILFEEEG